MGDASALLLVLALIAYAGSTAFFVAHLVSKKPVLARIGLRVLFGGLFLHALGKAIRFALLGAVPVKNPFEAMSMLALVAGLLFVWVARRYRVPVLGAFAVPFVTVTLAASLAFTSSDEAVPSALRSAWFPVHLGLAITGDALLALAGVVSIAYLIQGRLLRRKKLGATFRNLPALHVLDEISHRLLSVGFLFMTLGIAAGSLFAKQRWGAYWQWDPKQTWSLATWLLLAAVLHMRITVGWQGRRAAWMVIVTVGLVLGALYGINVLTTTRHGGDFQ